MRLPSSINVIYKRPVCPGVPARIPGPPPPGRVRKNPFCHQDGLGQPLCNCLRIRLNLCQITTYVPTPPPRQPDWPSFNAHKRAIFHHQNPISRHKKVIFALPSSHADGLTWPCSARARVVVRRSAPTADPSARCWRGERIPISRTPTTQHADLDPTAWSDRHAARVQLPGPDIVISSETKGAFTTIEPLVRVIIL